MDIAPSISNRRDRAASATGDPDGLPDFEAEAEPAEFLGRRGGETASGAFAALAASPPAASGERDADWDLDLSPAAIAGEGIAPAAPAAAGRDEGNDFLETSGRGRKSLRRAVVQAGARMSISQELCLAWAEEILAKGRCSLDDIDRLAARCEGNGDPGDLRANLERGLEAAGFDIERGAGGGAEPRDAVPDASPEDLADLAEAALTRRTRLPGTRRFALDKPGEERLLRPLARARRELRLRILASGAAVEIILDAMDGVRDGSRDPGSVSLKAIGPGLAEAPGATAAAGALGSWRAAGGAMEGKRRRRALEALEALDLSPEFHEELVRRLRRSPALRAEAGRLEAGMLALESAIERLVLEHLPYARRLASRNTGEGEDPEDVFQAATMGLLRAPRRFDPGRGCRFVAYAGFWMRQAITQWRAAEGAAIRVPAHLGGKIARLDRALDGLASRAGGPVSDLDLAEELEWPVGEVGRLRGIPREAEYPASADEWDGLLPGPPEACALDQAETGRVVAGALAELPERQVGVIRMRFGIGRDSGMTLEEVARIHGVTRERVRQLEARGLERLSRPGPKKRLRRSLGM